MLRWFITIFVVVMSVAVSVLWLMSEKIPNHYSEDQLEPFLAASEVELLSVHPSQFEYGEDPFAPDAPEPQPLRTPFGGIHGYPVLGVWKITGAEENELIRAAIRSLHSAGKRWEGAIAACFNPRHAVRVRIGDMTHDLLICYECSQVQIFRADLRVGDIYFSSSDGTPEPSPDALNDILTAHAIKLPEH